MKNWIFTKEEILNNPSSLDGITDFDELRYRQNASSFIHECGTLMKLSQGTINTGIILMHRFYMLNSFAKFDKYEIATASLFLAWKLSDNQTELHADHVIRAKNLVQRRDSNSVPGGPKQNLYDHELVMLQTFGFNLQIYEAGVITEKMAGQLGLGGSICGAINFLTTNALYVTRFCLEMKPEVLAATCIYMALEWAGIDIAKSVEGKKWWKYLDSNLTEKDLIKNVAVYLEICQKYPAKIKDRSDRYLQILQNDAKFVKQ
jgi:cyclin T